MLYKNRIADEMLATKLKSKGACIVEGAKWCGKTTTALQCAKSVLRMDEPSSRKINIQMAQINPSRLLKGETPRLIDEWQLAPTLFDAIRYEVDTRGLEGQFILTGSSVLPDSPERTHSGTGRYTWLKMRPMSLFESLESTGEVSLGELFKAPSLIEGSNRLSFDDLSFATCRGGWPHAVGMEKDIALLQAFDYVDGVAKSDISRVDGVRRNEETTRRLLRSYARNIASQVSYEEIKKDTDASSGLKIAENTFLSYVNALKKIYLIEDMAAWNPNLRSKTAVRTSDTRFFVDPSLAVAALGLGVEDLSNDLHTFGFLFECLCVRDLRIYAESLGGNVYHYRDKNGLECDAVVHLKNGKYGLIEIKLGGDAAIAEAKKTLNELASLIDTSKMKEPSFKMVLIGVGDYAYRDEDGIYIVPIGCLKN